MKRSFYLFGLLFVASLIFTACVGDNEPAVYATRININTHLALAVGETKTLIATVEPENAINRALVWTSSNSSVASIDAHGRITAHTTGTALISVNIRDKGGNIDVPTAHCLVGVSRGKTAPTQGGIIINGIEWATRNVDMPGTFAENPEDAGMFFQWNRRVSWSSKNPMVNSDGGTTWDSSPSTGSLWQAANDPCPIGWRVPTYYELILLAMAADNSWVSNWSNTDVRGQIFGTVPNQIFLPAVGYRNSVGSLHRAGTQGVYWSNTQRDNIVQVLRFDSALNMGTTGCLTGGSVRCVAE